MLNTISLRIALPYKNRIFKMDIQELWDKTCWKSTVPFPKKIA